MVDNAEFKTTGVFAELTHQQSDSDRFVGGFRNDWWKAAYLTTPKNRSDNLYSGFLRYETKHNNHLTSYIGFGHAERGPDYWELTGSSAAINNFYSTKKEQTNQLDVGQIYKSDKQSASISAFYGKINDFILMSWDTGMKMVNGVSNIDAQMYGVEASYGYQISNQVKFISSANYVRGKDETNNRPLPQLPPLEGRLGLSYDNQKWSAGGLLRFVTSQDRYVSGYGNIAGYDIGKTGGFAVFSLNGGYKFDKKTRLAFGVDNLFDKTYAEFVSRSGMNGMAPVNPATTRVNEPGRTAWLKATIALD